MMPDATTTTREDDHPIANVFRKVCAEQLGRVPTVECYVADDTDLDVMEVRLVCVTGTGRIELEPFKVAGQASMTDEEWYREMRGEMRRWFKGVRKGRGL